jgi:hypothetical protein
VCVRQDSSSQDEGICVECADSLDCKGQKVCDVSENTCKKGPEIIASRCGPQFDNIHTYEIEVPLHAGTDNSGSVNLEISKWPVYVSHITLETSDKGRRRMDSIVGNNVYLASVDMSSLAETDNGTALLPYLFSFPEGLKSNGDGSYVVDSSKSATPAIGRYIMFGEQGMPGGPSLEDIARVKACVRRADYDWQGNPLNPISGRMYVSRYEEEAVARGVQTRATQSKRFCPGYSYDGSPMCPEGQECVGIYIGGNKGNKEVGSTSCLFSAAFFDDGKCQSGDIQLKSTATKCSGGIIGGTASFPLCGSCEAPKAPDCEGEVQEAFIESYKYPSTPTEMSASGATLTSETTVRNQGDNEQSTTVTLQFSSTTTTTVTITNALAKNIQASLKMTLPLPSIAEKAGLEGSVTAGQTETFTDAESKATSSTLQITNAQTVKVPPKTAQTVIGSIQSKNVRLTIPVTIKVRYTCGKEDETIESTAEMTSNGALVQGSTSFDITYGPSQKLP